MQQKSPLFLRRHSFYKIWLLVCAVILVTAIANSIIVYFQVSRELNRTIRQRLEWEAHFYCQQLDAVGAQLDLNSALIDDSNINSNLANIHVYIYTSDGILVACPYRYQRGNLRLFARPSHHPLIRLMLAHPMYKLSIQPLIENCFKHGVEKSLDPVSIHLSISRKADTLEIRVADNGPGVTPERLQEINPLLDREIYEANCNHGLGLANIHLRYRYAYGKGYGIRLQSADPGLTVYLTIPIL